MTSPLISEGYKLSFTASGSINQGDVVYIPENGKVKVAHFGQAASGIGVAFMSGSEGGLITVITHGLVEVTCTGSVSPGDPVTVSGAGKVAALSKVALSGATVTANGPILSANVLGFAITSGTNQKIDVLLIR
jgi:hypothetical protein